MDVGRNQDLISATHNNNVLAAISSVFQTHSEPLLCRHWKTF